MSRRGPTVVALVGPAEVDAAGVRVSIVVGGIVGPSSAQSAAAISLGAIARAHGARFVVVTRPSRLRADLVRTLDASERWVWSESGQYCVAYVDENGSTPRSSFRPLDRAAFLAEARRVLVGSDVDANAAE